VFDPEVHLEGYGEARSGDPFLWRLEERFAKLPELRGRRIADRELRELKDEWSRHRAAVQRRLAAIRDLPGEKSLHHLERIIWQHPFFGEVGYATAKHPPFVFFIQQPLKERPDYEKEVTAKFLPWLRKLEEIFNAEYVQPLKLERRQGSEWYGIAVLASRGNYGTDYAAHVRAGDLHMTAAHYDLDRRLAVTYEDMTPLSDDQERRHAILHEFIHALQHAHYRGQSVTDRMPPLCFAEGLAEYWSSGEKHEVEDLGEPAVGRGTLEAFCALASSDRAPVFISALQDLITARGSADVVLGAAQRQAYLRGLPLDQVPAFLGSPAALPFKSSALGTFYSHSTLLVHFLHEHHKPEFMAWAGKLMRGGRAWYIFESAFDGLPADQLEDEFFAYLGERYRRLHPELAGPPARPGLLALASIAASISSKRQAGPQSPPGKAGEAPASAFAPGQLVLTEEEWKARLALAVALAARGELKRAAARLEECAGSTADREAAARMERERDRLRELLELRAGLLAVGETVQGLEIGDRSYSGKVTELEEDAVHVGSEKIPLERIDAANLYRHATSGKKLRILERWLGAYLLLLSGDAKKAESELASLPDVLKSHPAVEALRQDLGDYAELRQLGPPALLVDGLSRRTPAADENRAGVDGALADIRALVGRHGEVGLVAGRLPRLRTYAGELLGRRFDPRDRQCLGVHGELEPAGEAGVRLTYRFESAAEGEDFRAEPDYMSAWREQLLNTARARQIASGGESGFEVEKNKLRGAGATCCRYVLPFAAPFEVDCRVSFIGRGGQCYFVLGVCDDGRERNIRATNFGELISRDDEHGERGVIAEGVKPELAHEFYYRLVHTGNSVEYIVDGKKRVRLTVDRSLSAGSLFFWIHADVQVRISELVITARLDDGQLRQAWVATKLGEIF
jgi:hypothetical protein